MLTPTTKRELLGENGFDKELTSLRSAIVVYQPPGTQIGKHQTYITILQGDRPI